MCKLNSENYKWMNSKIKGEYKLNSWNSKKEISSAEIDSSCKWKRTNCTFQLFNLFWAAWNQLLKISENFMTNKWSISKSFSSRTFQAWNWKKILEIWDSHSNLSSQTQISKRREIRHLNLILQVSLELAVAGTHQISNRTLAH